MKRRDFFGKMFTGLTALAVAPLAAMAKGTGTLTARSESPQDGRGATLNGVPLFLNRNSPDRLKWKVIFNGEEIQGRVIYAEAMLFRHDDGHVDFNGQGWVVLLKFKCGHKGPLNGKHFAYEIDRSGPFPHPAMEVLHGSLRFERRA